MLYCSLVTLFLKIITPVFESTSSRLAGLFPITYLYLKKQYELMLAFERERDFDYKTHFKSVVVTSGYHFQLLGTFFFFQGKME